MIKTARSMSELWQIVCIKCNFDIGDFVGFIVRNGELLMIVAR